MRKSSNNFFHFTTTEKKATKIILVVLGLLILFRLSFTFLFASGKESEKNERYQKEISEFFNEKQTSSDSLNDEQIEVDLIAFNPDTLSAKGWVKLGFSPKEATSILKYKKMVGGFDSPETIKKSYVISNEAYERLLPHMVFESMHINRDNNISNEGCYALIVLKSDHPVYGEFQDFDSLLLIKNSGEFKYCENIYETEDEAKSLLKSKFSGEGLVESVNCELGFWIYPNRKKNKQIITTNLPKSIIEINTADTSEFKTLKGIGIYYAKKIVNFRNKLGGFYSVDQLKEVYGIDQELISNNLGRFKVDDSKVVKLNINQLSDKELKKHPYISWQVANSIYFYRLNHGEYKSIEEITKSDVVTPELYEKLKHYITVTE